jgi:hypothetical protein
MQFDEWFTGFWFRGVVFKKFNRIPCIPIAYVSSIAVM